MRKSILIALLLLAGCDCPAPSPPSTALPNTESYAKEARTEEVQRVQKQWLELQEETQRIQDKIRERIKARDREAELLQDQIKLLIKQLQAEQT